MIASEPLEHSLTEALPAEFQAQAPELARLIRTASESGSSRQDLQVLAEPGLAPLLRTLAGRQLAVEHSLITFGANNQFGDISIGQIAGGDIVTINVTLVQRPAPGTPFLAPPLPMHFVPRLEIIKRLRDALLNSPAAVSALPITALHGLGGVGKTILAATLAHDPVIQERFPDGVLWVTLGQQPDLLSLQRGWIEALGSYQMQPLSVDVATAHLRSLLYQKRVLLVVDDVWEPEHLLAFIVGGPHCHVLLTSREALVATAVGALHYDVGVLSSDQAVALLQHRLGRQLTGDELSLARELARAVGYLPLALELASAQLADGVPWGELIADLAAEVARLDSLDLPGAGSVRDPNMQRRLSLQASFALSLRRLSVPERVAFASLGVLPEDCVISAAMAATLWDTSARVARDRLRVLRDRALLLPGSPQPNGAPTFRLHDLVHDTARHLLTAPVTPCDPDDLPGLGLRLPRAHAALLERYRAGAPDGWHTLANDGYIHSRLTWHMEQAGQPERIHELLHEEAANGRNAWYQARERLGQVAGFLDDLARAQRLLLGTPDATLASHHSRYSLTRTAITSMAAQLSPDLIIALVNSGVWGVPQALTFARRLPNPAAHALALCGLVPHMPEDQRATLVDEVQVALVTALRSNRGLELDTAGATVARRFAAMGYQRAAFALAISVHAAETIVALANNIADQLPEALRAQVLARAIEAALTPADSRLVAQLAPRLSLVTQLHGLRVLREFSAPEDQARALAAIAPYLADEARSEAEECVRLIGNPLPQAQALIALACRFTAPDDLARHALESVISLRDVLWRSALLGELAPALSPPLLSRALDAAWAIKDPYYQLAAVAGLSICLPLPAQREQLTRLLPTSDPEQQTIIEPIRILVHNRVAQEAVRRLVPRLAQMGYQDEMLALAPNFFERDAGEGGTAPGDQMKGSPDIGGETTELLQQRLAASQAINDADQVTKSRAGLEAVMHFEGRAW